MNEKMRIIITIQILVLFVNSMQHVNAEWIQSGLISRKYCAVVNQTNYPGHYSLVQLKCDWHQFLQYLMSNSVAVSNENYIYEIEFYRKQSYSLSSVDPFEITPETFKKFQIRKLSFNSLGIKYIHPNAFSKCCENTLLSLDLSGNKLKRIDDGVLSSLSVLRNLNLASNPGLQLKNENFKGNKELKYINLSSTEMQFLPANVFRNLNRLEIIDLSKNNLKTLDACVFYPLYSDLKQAKNLKSEHNISRIQINALSNTINCNCDVFYLEREANLDIDLVCGEEPSYYEGKKLKELFKEDPENINCFYKDIEFNCRAQYEDSNKLLKNFELYRILVIILSCFLSVATLLVICLWCRVRTYSGKLKESRAEDPSHQSKKAKGFSLVAHGPSKTEYKELQQSAE